MQRAETDQTLKRTAKPQWTRPAGTQVRKSCPAAGDKARRDSGCGQANTAAMLLVMFPVGGESQERRG
jgi:hypothetical protein